MTLVAPCAQLKAKDVDVGLLRASPTRLALIRSWDVDLKRVGVSFKVNGSAGITYQGALCFEPKDAAAGWDAYIITCSAACAAA